MRITKVTIDLPASVSERLISADIAKDPKLHDLIDVALSLSQTIAPAETSSNEQCIAKLERICNCFHQVSQQLLRRREGRPTLKIEDEYDVQDLLHTLLLLHFLDIRREEWIPTYAGGSSRADFLLKPEQTIIEVKMARDGLKARELGEQLIIDIAKYREHPQCKHLVCFVYDPHLQITNPRGIEHDLSKLHDGMAVRVLIVPKGL